MVSAQANKFCGLLPKRNSFGSFFLSGPPLVRAPGQRSRQSAAARAECRRMHAALQQISP